MDCHPRGPHAHPTSPPPIHVMEVCGGGGGSCDVDVDVAEFFIAARNTMRQTLETICWAGPHA